MTLDMSAIMQKWQVNPKREHFKTTLQFLKGWRITLTTLVRRISAWTLLLFPVIENANHLYLESELTY